MALTSLLGLAMRTSSTAPPQQALSLPAPVERGSISLEEALRRRRSVRSFAESSLTVRQISQLLWAAQGVTSPEGFRTAPSAGALYPLEVYLVTSQQVARYEPARHRLIPHLAGDQRPPLARAALGQEAVARAPALFVIAAVPSRTAAKYGSRAERYVALEAGHAAQNLLLEATALGLAGVPVGAFDDSAVAGALHLPSNQEPLYLLPVGQPAR
jgi:SagB-type dehydrogenase family enzyme